MKGIVKNIVANRNFGFIRASGVEYFFHRENFNGHWEDLEADIKKKDRVEVEFEVQDSPKGPRAKDVKRTDFPN